jgi:peroxiredoxin
MSTLINVGETLPEVTMPFRADGEWKFLNTKEQFAGKRVVIFALPGAFTPTCSSFQLPGFETMYSQFQEKGIEDIYCLSVNDSFVMNSWFEAQGIENVKPLPDGNGEFTEYVGASVAKANVGFGIRSWRYAMVVNDNVVEAVFAEEGFGDNIESDPYEVSTPENVLENL